MLNYNLIRSLNAEQLMRKDLAGSKLDFISINDSLVFMQKHLLFFQGNEGQLTQTQRDNVTGSAAAFEQYTNQITEFKPNDNENLESALARNTEITNKVKQLEQSFCSTILPIISHIKLNSDEMQQNVTLLNTKIASIDQILPTKILEYDTTIKSKITAADEAIQKANQLVAEARDFSTDKLVDKYGPIFEKEAKNNWRIAMVSLSIFIASTLSTLWGAIYLFSPLLSKLENFSDGDHIGYIASNVIFRLVILSIGLLFIKESLKNYDVNMNLYNLNKHRQNSLLSFNTFLGTTIYDETKTQLIKEIAKTIYSVSETGYLTKEGKSLSTNQIIELIKSIRS